MSANFDYIRKKRTVGTIINSTVIAVACFAIFYGVFMLISKLNNTDISPLIQLSVSIGAGLIAGGIVALVTFKSKKQLAKELDDAYSLHERIQTMVMFENDNGYIARVQREDTEKHLNSINDKRPLFKQFGAAIISMVLAVAIMLPAVLVPRAAEIDDGNDTPPVYIEPFELESWQTERLKKLIETVNAAEIDGTFKSATVTELTRLLEVLKSTDTKDKMIAEVLSSIVLIDAAAEKTASYKLIAVALFSAKPLTDKDTGEIIDPETYKQIKNLARYIIKLNGIDFGQDIKSVRKYFEADTVISDESADETPDNETKEATVTVITVNDKLTNFKNELVSVLGDKNIPEGDAIKAHLLEFSAKLAECTEKENEKERQSLIDKAFDELSDRISTVLSAQYENKAVRDNVINTLMLLFGIEKDMLPKLLGDTVPTLTDSNEESGGSDETGSISGGYGDGNELWGSNDTVYDPFGKDGASHALYGDVFDDYYRKISELLSDESLSEETRQAIAEYFQKLSDGSKK